jgi:hypothetical protein
VEETLGDRRRRRVRLCAHLELRGGHELALALVERRRILRDAKQVVAIRREHFVEEPGREDLVHGSPREAQRAVVVLRDLVLEPHLWSPQDRRQELERGRLRVVAKAIEHDGHGGARLVAMQPRELAHDLQAGEGAHLHVLVDARGQALRTRRERVLGATRFDGDEQRLGEIADETIDVRMKRQTRRDRQVDRERRPSAPRREDLRERGEEEPIRTDLRLAGALLEERPRCGLDARAPVREVHLGEDAARPRERKIRRRGQLREPRPPGVARAEVIRVVLLLAFGENVVAKRDVERRELRGWILVERQPLVDLGLRALRVRDEEVEPDVQAREIVRKERRADLVERIAIDVGVEARHLFADALDRGVHLGGARATQIEDVEPIRRNLPEDLLLARGRHDEPQRAVARDDSSPRGLEPRDVHRSPLQLEIRLDGGVPERDVRSPAEPVRLLDGTKRKPLGSARVHHGCSL